MSRREDSLLFYKDEKSFPSSTSPDTPAVVQAQEALQTLLVTPAVGDQFTFWNSDILQSAARVQVTILAIEEAERPTGLCFRQTNGELVTLAPDWCSVRVQEVVEGAVRIFWKPYSAFARMYQDVNVIAVKRAGQ